MDEKPNEPQFPLFKPWRWPLDVLALFVFLGVAWALIQLDYLHNQKQTQSGNAVILPAHEGALPVGAKEWRND